MARRIVNRKEKRAEFEAYERTSKEDEEREDEEEEEEEDEESEEEGEADEEAGDEGGSEEDEDEEEAPRPKKKKEKEPKPAKAKGKPRARAAKIVRMKVVWAVYNNSNQQVKTFEYPERKAADDYAAKMSADKKSTFFVQPLKKPIEEKKEE